MSSRMRKLIVISLIGLILLTGNILLVANWLADTGIIAQVNWLRERLLTGTLAGKSRHRCNTMIYNELTSLPVVCFFVVFHFLRPYN